MTRYLEFVQAAMQTLLERQSARLGGEPDGTLCITVTRRSSKTNRRVQVTREGAFRASSLVVEQPVEQKPYRLDLHMWPVLELLSDVTGDPKYRQMAIDMAIATARYGFEPVSGLGYLGVTAEFDVLQLRPVAESSRTKPLFKPGPDLPLDRLWTQAPEQMARMFKSAYYALITRPGDMAYNRTCPYGFNASKKQPALGFNSQHVGFAQTGATLILWWGYLFVRTGDAECLAWAQAMADKWQAVQHPDSGLVPHCFGSDRSGEPVQPPWEYANSEETTTGILLLQAASELEKRPEGRALAEQMRGMAERLLHGIARYGYDSEKRIFPQWLYLDGRVPRKTVFYTFPSQEEKDRAIKQDPLLEEVVVYPGSGFYTAGPWALGVNNPVPLHLALAATWMGDADLLARVSALVADIMAEAEGRASEFNALDQWTYPATAGYIKTMLILYDAKKETHYLDFARRLADMELEFLNRPMPEGKPEWWQMPFRSELLEALLLLHRELVEV